MFRFEDIAVGRGTCLVAAESRKPKPHFPHVIVDLVETTTADGLRLDGVWQSPAEGAWKHSEDGTAEAVILVHGTGGSFYSSKLLAHLASLLVACGRAALRVNTRGHDLVSTASTTRGGVRQGAGYEVLDECRHDLTAWCELARHRGAERIVLLGHSSGAIKVLYAQAHQPHPRVSGQIALSPPRLSYQWFVDSHQSERFLADFRQAEDYVATERGGELLNVRFPLPMTITAAGYLEKYGPTGRYNVADFIGQIQSRSLVTFGSEEVQNHVAFSEHPSAIEAAAGNGAGTVDVAEIAGANHFYDGTWDTLWSQIRRWLFAQDSAAGS